MTQFLRFSDAEQEFIGHPCLIRMESKTAALKAFESGDMVFDSQVWEVKVGFPQLGTAKVVSFFLPLSEVFCGISGLATSMQ